MIGVVTEQGENLAGRRSGQLQPREPRRWGYEEVMRLTLAITND